MSRFLDPKADLTFKKVFGEHKHLVMSLLNALLPLEEGRKVESIEYLPPEMTPRTPLIKDTIVDVRCEETGGRKFIVEMQMNWRSNYEQRALYNAAKAYAGQLPKGKDYDILQPVYSLNLINDVFDPDAEEYYHYYHLVHDQDPKKTLDGLHLVFVELPKFKPGNLAEKKMQVLWLRFLTEIDEKTRRPPQELVDDPHVNEALEIVEEASFSRGEMLAYDKFWDRMSREAGMERERREMEADKAWVEREKREIEADRAWMEREKREIEADKAGMAAEREALKVATAERDAATAERDAATAERDAATAERDAAMEKLRQSVRQMKADGIGIEVIAKYTGLTADEINGVR